MEDLLKPRYKVVADYPFNIHCKVGDILSLNNKNNQTPFASFGDDFSWYEADFDSYPNIFKKLEWWEEREESEMPEYVNIIDDYTWEKKYGNGRVYKYSNWMNESGTESSYDMIGFIYDEKAKYGKAALYSTSFLPATKQEYETQQNQTKYEQTK